MTDDNENQQKSTITVTLEEAESHQWWSDFLRARTYAIKCMRKLGKEPKDIVNILNLEDELHLQRIMIQTKTP